MDFYDYPRRFCKSSLVRALGVEEGQNLSEQTMNDFPMIISDVWCGEDGWDRVKTWVAESSSRGITLLSETRTGTYWFIVISNPFRIERMDEIDEAEFRKHIESLFG